MKRTLLGMAFLGLLGLASQAQAGFHIPGTPVPPPTGSGPTGGGPDPSFEFAFTSNDGTVGAFGVLQGTSNSDGTFTATSGTIVGLFGTTDNTSGTLYPNPTPPAEVVSPSGFFLYDNQLLPGQNPLITNGGLLFILGSGVELNIYSNGPGPGTYTLYENNGFNINGNFALTPVGSVPEPSSLVLCGLGGLATLVGVRARRRKAATLA